MAMAGAGIALSMEGADDIAAEAEQQPVAATTAVARQCAQAGRGPQVAVERFTVA
jgi:hypothetical protein